MTSAPIGGRPTGLDLQAQYRAKPRRCQAMTVDGLTIASASAQRPQNRETITQKARSIGRRRGRGVARRRTASCWRSTRFSRTRFARGRSAANAAPEIAISIASAPSRSISSVAESPSNRLGRSVRLVGSACPRCPLQNVIFTTSGVRCEFPGQSTSAEASPVLAPASPISASDAAPSGSVSASAVRKRMSLYDDPLTSTPWDRSIMRRSKSVERS